MNNYSHIVYDEEPMSKEELDSLLSEVGKILEEYGTKVESILK